MKELKRIAPETFADGKVNWETLKEALGVYTEDESGEIEHFGLFWPGKKEARKIASIPSQGTLVPIYGEGLKADSTPDTDGVNDSQNIFIEGENLEVLKILQKSYAGRIKMIYIDPPYNTGNDFVYDDNFIEPLQEYLRRTGQIDEEGKPLSTNKKADGRFHSKWLSMMYPRLRLARTLLQEDGVVLIHIDENEVFHLVTLMNEIFGEENNIGTITWDKKNPKGDARGIAYQNESIICYIKNKEELVEKSTIQRPKKNAEKILKKADDFFKLKGKRSLPLEIKSLIKKYGLNQDDFKDFSLVYNLDLLNEEFSNWIRNQDFSGGEIAYSKIDELGNVYRTVSMAWPNKKKAPDEYFIPLLHPKTKKACPLPERGWRYPPQTMLKLLENNEIIFGKDHTTQPTRKYLLKDNMNENIPSIISFGGSDDDLFSKWGIPFDNPKPFKFCSELIKYFTQPGDIVLDFFAGSGTVGHSIYELGLLEKSRKFILIQMPEIIEEKSLAYKFGFRKITEITQKRLKCSSDSYTWEANRDLGFNKFCLCESNMQNISVFKGSNQSELEMHFESSIGGLNPKWSRNGLLTEILLNEGFPLISEKETLKHFKKNELCKLSNSFTKQTMILCLDNSLFDDTIKKLSLEENQYFVCLDEAITDQAKLRLSDKGLIKTI